MNDTIGTIIFIGLWALGGVFFIITGTKLRNDIKKKEISCTSKTYGKVIDLERYDDALYPIFEYTIGDLTFTKKYTYGSNPPQYAIGQNVEIYYNPEDYNEFYIAGNPFPKVVGMTFILGGIFSIVISIIFAILALTGNINIELNY